MKFSSIFISKNLEEVELLSKFCEEKEISLFAQSLIEFSAVHEEFDPTSEVYFFGSKNAFDFYLLARVKQKPKFIATIGLATRKHIESLGFRVDFWGEKAGNPAEVSAQFLAWLGTKKVAFFQSSISKHSIAQSIPSYQKEEFVCYETKEKTQIMPQHFDVYVFTSPSNVKAFLLKNTLPKEAKVIAWGKTTEQELLKQNFQVSCVLKSASQEELIEFFGT